MTELHGFYEASTQSRVNVSLTGQPLPGWRSMLYPGQDHWPEYLFQSPFVIPVFSFSCPQGIQTIGMFPYKIIKMFVHMYIPLQFNTQDSSSFISFNAHNLLPAKQSAYRKFH
jgi:hypothetical protein